MTATGMKLRDYQEETLTAIDRELARNKRKQLIVIPTGGGKTVVFSTAIHRRRMNNPRQLPTLILAHRDELLTQAAEKIVDVAPELEMSIGFIKAGRNDVNKDIIIASVQTLSRLPRRVQLPKEFQTVVIDEAHHAASDSYVKILEYVQSDLYLGVTATPDRTDKKRLDRIFDVVAMEISIEELINRGYLVPPRGKRIGIEVDLGSVKTSRGDFQAGDLADALEAANAPNEVLSAYLEHGENRTGLIFTPTVDQAYDTAKVFRDAGVPVEALDGDTPTEERRLILERLAKGQTRLVANVGVLTEGYDEPSLSIVIVASPTKSRSKYCQMIGRGLRLHPAKEDCLILDLAGASEELSIQSLPAFFGLKDEDEDVRDAIARHGAGGEAPERDPDDAQPKHQPTRKGTLIKDVGFFPRERLHWIRVNRGWVLDLGERKQLVLRAIDKDESGWQVLLVKHDSDTFNLRGEHPNISFGQGIAEEIVREEGLLKIVDKQAAWRRGPVTKTQLAALKRMGISETPTNSGEASNLIAKANANRTLARLDKAMARRNSSPNRTPRPQRTKAAAANQ